MPQLKEIQFLLYSSENINKLCEIIYDVFRKKLSILVLFDTVEDSHCLDEALWSYDIQKFIPHHIFTKTNTMLAPVTLAAIDNYPALYNFQILINFSAKIPENYKNLHKIFEMVLPDVTQKAIAREHYKFYKAQNYNINTLNLQDSTDVTQ